VVVVIGFDTATDDTAVAALRDGAAVSSRTLGPRGDGRPAHATQLLTEVESAVEGAGGWEGVTRIAVGVGPGSFTGLRVGIATARSLAQALDLELAGVGTLAALARGAVEETGRCVVPVLDARRGEVFAAVYERGLEEVKEPFVASPDELTTEISQLPEPALAVGSGAVRFRGQLEKGGVEVPGDADPVHRIAAEQICVLGAAASASSPEDVTPIYLRQPDAERWLERDRTEH
jgi:tRNA threonylcarbamoyladenosine biosynthesis protein TsaB